MRNPTLSKFPARTNGSKLLQPAKLVETTPFRLEVLSRDAAVENSVHLSASTTPVNFGESAGHRRRSHAAGIGQVRRGGFCWKDTTYELICPKDHAFLRTALRLIE
jgi:hypothetical protein